MEIDLENDLGREALAKKIVADIDEYCLKAYDDGHRAHLGASLIGHPCSYYLWLSFRWAFREQFNPRMLRLFNRGHLEESRWIEWLRGTGWTIKAAENDGKQIRVSGSGEHFGGSLDTEATHTLFPGVIFLVEYKTFGTGPYGKLLASGVRKERPKHWAQMCLYGKKRGLQYAIYCPINKNDDDISGVEVVKLDWRYAEELEAKAHAIVTAKTPPEKISINPAYSECRHCPALEYCHNSKPIEKNCRSCRHSEPRDNAEWFCNNFQDTIPKEYIPNGCPSWYGII